MLYVLKKNVGWKCSIYGSTISQSQAIEKEIKNMYNSLIKDMKIVNMSDLPQYQGVNPNQKIIVKSFEDTMKAIKEEVNPIVVDFMKVALVEAIFILCTNHLPNYVDQTLKMRQERDTWKIRLLILKNSNLNAIQEFISPYQSQKLTCGTIGEDNQTEEVGENTPIYLIYVLFFLISLKSKDKCPLYVIQF